MRHPQTFVLLLVAVVAATALLLSLGSIWGALGALICGLALAFVFSMAWLWSPRSGVGSRRRPSHDSFSGLK